MYIHKISLLHMSACEDCPEDAGLQQSCRSKKEATVPTPAHVFEPPLVPSWEMEALLIPLCCLWTLWLSLSGQQWACSWRSSVHLPDICRILKTHAVSGEALRVRRNRNTVTTVKLSIRKSGDWIIPICAGLTEEKDPRPAALALELSWSRKTCPLWSQVLCLLPGWQRRIRMSSSH